MSEEGRGKMEEASLGKILGLRSKQFGNKHAVRSEVRKVVSELWERTETDNATPRTSSGVRSDQDLEADPAVATRATQEAPKRR